jgi:hypothetical protein
MKRVLCFFIHKVFSKTLIGLRLSEARDVRKIACKVCVIFVLLEPKVEWVNELQLKTSVFNFSKIYSTILHRDRRKDEEI